MNKKTITATILGVCLVPSLSYANGTSAFMVDVESSPIAIITIVIFCCAYALVMLEDVIHLNKSKPVILASGIIWVLVAIVGKHSDQSQVVIASFQRLFKRGQKAREAYN